LTALDHENGGWIVGSMIQNKEKAWFVIVACDICFMDGGREMVFFLQLPSSSDSMEDVVITPRIILQVSIDSEHRFEASMTQTYTCC
jgi:hypothetical protein